MEIERESVHQGDEVTPLQLITASATKMLVCVADQVLAERIARAVKGLEWQVVVALAPVSALSQLENTQYDLVVLHERYGGSSLAGNSVLQHLQRLPMGLRRASLLCLICEETPSLDYMAAFRVGANLIVNVQDIEKLQNVLSHMMKQHQASYAIFDDELSKRGTTSG
jgi:DNA-binding response OmpR family regulator